MRPGVGRLMRPTPLLTENCDEVPLNVHGPPTSDVPNPLLTVRPNESWAIVAGQAAIDRYDQAGVTIPASKFVIVGRPQMSPLQRADRPIAEIDPPTVLFAPTWRGYNAQTTLSSLPVGDT